MPAQSQHTASYYAASARQPAPYPSLAGDLSADVCVVGGGLTGVNPALELAERGPSAVLLEGRRIRWGASARNGGPLTRGNGHAVSGFPRHVGQEGLRYLKQAGIDSVTLVADRIARYGIACDLRWGFCELANTPAQFESFVAEQDDLTSLGYRPETRLVSAERLHEVVASDRYAGGMVDMGSGHLHPLDLVQGEARAAAGLGVQLLQPTRSVERRLG